MDQAKSVPCMMISPVNTNRLSHKASGNALHLQGSQEFQPWRASSGHGWDPCQVPPRTTSELLFLGPLLDRVHLIHTIYKKCQNYQEKQIYCESRHVNTEKLLIFYCILHGL